MLLVMHQGIPEVGLGECDVDIMDQGGIEKSVSGILGKGGSGMRNLGYDKKAKKKIFHGNVNVRQKYKMQVSL